MPISRKATRQPSDPSAADALRAADEESFAAALSRATRTGKAVSADATLLDRFGIADHGEDLGDFDLIFPDRAS